MVQSRQESTSESRPGPASEGLRRAEDNANVRELRLGLVCYGGVSLAIYMHGITKELQKLVVASRAFEEASDRSRSPFGEKTVENAYWEALRTAWVQSAPEHPEDRVITRVVVDVVAGTSAGGINGVILCKALAHNRSQDALRDLWFQRGDFTQLLGGSWWKAKLAILKFAGRLLRLRPEPPLDGLAMLGWLRKALEDMDASTSPYRPAKGEAPPSLMPEGHPLQLFVTTTDYFGYRNSMMIEDPAMVGERRNRHLFKFRYEGGANAADQFGAAYNGALAFAARATSSFPGAFPPVNLAMTELQGADLSRFESEFFDAYRLSGAEACKTYFVDGGVLNNYPFEPAIRAIFRARAEAEVDRYLLYLQPDPGGEVQNPDGEAPTFFGAVWAGLSSVAAAQPIYDQLVAVRDFNERVRMVDEMIEGTKPAIAPLLANVLQAAGGSASLRDPLPSRSSQQLADLRAKVEEQAEQESGFLYRPYLELRVESVVAQLAAVAASLCGYSEPESNIVYFIRLCLHGWASDRKLVGHEADLKEIKEFLRSFDLGYTRRRLAFVSAWVSEAYQRGSIPRVSLNRAKAALFDRMDELSGMMAGKGVEPLAEKLKVMFPLTLLAAAAKQPAAELVHDFVQRHGKDLDALRAEVDGLFRTRKDGVQAKLYEDFTTITAQWPATERAEVVVRYLGFPFWDAMIYPLIRLSEAGELRELKVVRMSPLDSTQLGALKVGEKLMGVRLFHFGAFQRRDWRENDYLWGRLDAAERLVGLVLKDPRLKSSAQGGGYRAQPWQVKPAFEAILEEEKGALKALAKRAPKRLAKIRKRVADLPGSSPP
jgi:patatin-related protein